MWHSLRVIWLANVRKKSFLTSSDIGKIQSSLSKTETVVWSPTNIIYVVVILTVIFPKTDGAYVIGTALIERQKPATWACVFLVPRRFRNIRELQLSIPIFLRLTF